MVKREQAGGNMKIAVQEDMQEDSVTEEGAKGSRWIIKKKKKNYKTVIEECKYFHQYAADHSLYAKGKKCWSINLCCS